MLLVASLIPDYWFISFVALLPFLWRISRAYPGQSLRLGLLLGATYFIFLSLDTLFVSPLLVASKIIAGMFLFALWGWGVGIARQVFGFNPVIVAGLWVFFELGLVKLGYTTGLLAQFAPSNPLFLRLFALFGLGMLSFLFVLLNSVLVKTIEYASKLLKASAIKSSTVDHPIAIIETVEVFTQNHYLIHLLRGPPLRNYLPEASII